MLMKIALSLGDRESRRESQCSSPKAKAVKQLQDDSVTDADGFAEGTVQMVVFCCGELFISRKEKSITQSTVVMAFHKALDMEGKVKEPKKLGTFGASYLYPLLLKLGVIQTETKSCII